MISELDLIAPYAIRATERAAISACKWIGSGEKEKADKAATESIRSVLNEMDFDATVVIGEGEKDKSYGLFEGEKVGKFGECRELEKFKAAFSPEKKYEVAVDPIEGTTPVVTSGPEAISTIAISHQDSLFRASEFYMRKLAYGPKIKHHLTLSLDDPIERTVELAATVTGKKVSDIMVCILNRERHYDVIKRLRAMNVRIKLIQDCDVSGAIATCLPESGVDILYGIGGSPEAVLSACAIKCLGGDFQAKEVTRDTWENKSNVYHLDDLVKGECVFAATGITDGSILKGVILKKKGPVTHSIYMSSMDGIVRKMHTHHGN